MAPRALQEVPRALQEAFNWLSATITRPRCSLEPFYMDFKLQEDVPGPQKSMKFMGQTIIFEEFAF